ncbi:MAG: hypothetical protein R3F34_19250 [Planctomycetota bacterium]
MKSIAAAVALVLSVTASCASKATAPATNVAATRAWPADFEGHYEYWLADFEAHYGYDTGYMEKLLDLSPAAFDQFFAAMGMSQLGEHLSPDEHYVGAISALMADDCGACTQLNLKMAVEEGVDIELLRTLVERPADLPPTLRTIHDYATQVVSGGNASPDLVRDLRIALGDEGFAELAVNVLGCRIYPGLRRAMGAETACPPLTLDF